MKIRSLLGRLSHSPMPPIAIITIFALAWITPSFCGEIHDAARDGDLQRVKSLLIMQLGAVSSKDDNGNTPLHCAAEKGHKDVAELLLSHKAEVNAQNNKGEIPLHLAAEQGNKEVVELLLANKSDVNAKTNKGMMPLDLAVSNNRKDVTELLSRRAGNNDVAEPYVVGNGVTAPVPLSMPTPRYPEEARNVYVSGIVLLQAIIRKDGTVTDVKVIKGLGHGLDESAIDTITTKWRFKPGTLNGNPVNVIVNIETRFARF
jgi:TonB family protein